MGQPALCCQGGLATTAGCCNALPPFSIGDITGSEDTVDGGLRSARFGDHISLGIQSQLPLQQIRVRSVANCIEQAFGSKAGLFSGAPIAQGQTLHPAIAAHIQHFAVPVNGDGWVGPHAVGHGGAGPELLRPHDLVNVTAVLGEINRLLTGGVTSSHHSQFGVAELRSRPIADGARTDAAAPEALLRGQAEAVRPCPGGDHQGMGQQGASISLDPEGALTEIDLIGIRFQQMCPPAHGLGTHQIHQVRTQNSVRETGEILHIGGGHQLTARYATALESSDQQRFEVGPGRVDRCGVAGRSRADDHEIFDSLRGAAGCHGLMRNEYELTL